MKKGVPVSPGVAVARAFCVDEVLARREAAHLEVAAVTGEIQRFEDAVSAAAGELDAIVERVAGQLGEEEAAIFRAHRLLLRDPALVGKVKSIILHRQVDAGTALHDTLEEYTALFARIPDEYLQERMADIRDVIGRILAQLALRDRPPVLPTTEPVILVAPEILPSQALSLMARPSRCKSPECPGKEPAPASMQVAGIITEAGGATGHAAILARSLGIPAVSGMRGILREVRTGDLIALDGREGHVYLNPGPEVEAAYRKLQREYVALCDSLIENRDLEPVTRDGERIELLANVNSPADAAMAVRAGASGVGLYRTEYLFLTHPTVPCEDEQLSAYREVIEAAPNHRVTIRTLDLGGDKQVPYFGHQREANPFMGWRSIRLSTAYPDFFRTQLRAILRASRFGQVSLLFPMVSTLEEVHRLKRMVQRTRRELQREGEVLARPIPLGVMLEVPAAALCVNDLLGEVDFVSIGSNDLIQYLMAADRDNPKVAHLCEPFSPALMRLLSQILKTCNARNKPVTLCGEMAGRPRCFLPLFGMGLRRLSMSPAFVPSMKEMIHRLTVEVGREVAERVVQMSTVGEIRGYLTRKVKQLWPDVSLLDMTR
ncbi:MAG: phosphoenolpyruvate--protein phosphotransferase [Planctomycetes bacterium]|nr:phosphoenolpyruvate--protein phosphotransferase [Planctomycetota bacterium]